MPTRPQINRADLLACLYAYGEAHLEACASVLGYARCAPAPLVPPPPPPQEAVAGPSAPTAARPTPVPRVRFPRVVAQRQLEAAEARRDEPLWYRDAVPVHPDDPILRANPQALLPCPQRWWDGELMRLFIPVYWDRAVPPPRHLVPSRRLAVPRPPPTHDPGAEQLLCLLGAAIRVEPALLRAVRYLLPARQVDAGSEAAAWNHPQVRVTPLAFSYEPDAIRTYREAFAAEPQPLRQRVAELMAAHHAHLSPVIGYEEQWLLTQADEMPTAPVTQGLLASLVKTRHTMSFEAGHAWLQRMVRRQHRQMWADEVLAAAWLTVHLDDVRAGKPLTPPDGLDLARVSWLLKQGAEARDYVLRQRGPCLYIEPETRPQTATGLEVPGSPLSPVRATSRYVQVQVMAADDTSGPGFWQPFEQGIALPAERKLRLCTDHQELTIDGIVRPAWAEGIGCDAHGLWVTWAQGQQRAYWVPPGPYPVHDRAGARLAMLPVAPPGHWHEATTALEHLSAGWQQPSWATAYGVDTYGLYASISVHGVEQRLRWIPPGEFTMGSPPDEPERDRDETQHRVILSHGFWLADTTCTQALWQVVMGENPSRFRGEERPVEQVSWEDVQRFLARINDAAPDLALRLPTEAEWEYACRAGTNTVFWFGPQITPEQVNYNGNYPDAGGKRGLYRQETVPVKALPCNGWGLYQMHGNVWEWCQDWYGAYPTETVVDPAGPAQGAHRVLRGGCWFDHGWNARSARRFASGPRYRVDALGFRLARGQVPGR